MLSSVVLLGSVVPSANAAAPLPAEATTQEVVYRIHDDPNDPNSPITFTIWLSLKQADVDEDSIGWEITRVRFREVGYQDTLWTESDPNVPTADGLWWVNHADPNAPLLEEFVKPPHLTGVADAEDQLDPDLDYEFQGVTYTPPPAGEPWDPTGALDYSFTMQGQSSPFASGEDKPTEMGDDDDPPM
jgi:hypothetical protein